LINRGLEGRKRKYLLTAGIHKRGTTDIALALKKVILLILVGDIIVFLPRKRRGERNVYFDIDFASPFATIRSGIRLRTRKRHSL